ncbi:MAG: serine/threonine protein kinase [Lysobacterales bacterium]
MNTDTHPKQIGKYWVKRLLGTGGMGRVFLAVDPDIGREVAIKLVTLGRDPQANERFLREAQTMGRLNHPNIVTLLEFGVDQQSPFLVLEFLSGEDLSQWMHRPQTLRAQVQVMLGVAEAIAAAHRVGVLHRDLKPENVRVLEDGRCKLLDFGIAQSGDSSLTASGYFVGTPEFVAPEVMSGASHTTSSDVYALGLLFYTLLAGENPFRGDTVQSTVARVVAAPLPALASRISGAPKPLLMLIEQCVQKLPEQRPASADDLVLRLREILAGIGPDARIQQIAPSTQTATAPIAGGLTRGASPVVPTNTRPASARGWWLAALVPVALAIWLLRPATVEQDPASTPPDENPAVVTTAPAPSINKVDDAGMAVVAESQTGPTPAAGVEPTAVRPPPETKADREGETQVPAPAPERPIPAASAPTKPSVPATQTTAAPVSSAPEGKPEQPIIQLPPAAQPAAEPTASQEPVTGQPSEVNPPLSIRIDRFSPRVIRAGRSVTLRIEGSGLEAIDTAMVSSGGVADTRFRIGQFKRRGDGGIEFNLNVARGVPLGSYALLLQGSKGNAEPIILEVSL